MKYGYARVSPGGKSESVDAQARQLTKAGCTKVFRDVHVSGAKTDRAQLRRVIEALEPADVLMVTRLDRLARSTRDLLNTLAAITAKKAGFKSLGDTWADTTISHGRLMLTVLGGLAEFERDLIRARTGEGRERAKARGVKMGRPHKAHRAPAERGDQAPRPGRGIAYRDRAQLQCERGDDFTISRALIHVRGRKMALKALNLSSLSMEQLPSQCYIHRQYQTASSLSYICHGYVCCRGLIQRLDFLFAYAAQLWYGNNNFTIARRWHTLTYLVVLTSVLSFVAGIGMAARGFSQLP